MIKETKRIHPIWNEIKKHKLKMNIIGKYQYTFSSKKGIISLISIQDYFRAGGKETVWEIYCLKGKLFKGTERFFAKDRAVERIKVYLNDGKE